MVEAKTSAERVDEAIFWVYLSGTNTRRRINEEFQRRTNTQASLPNEEAVLFLLFGLLSSGQVRPRRLVGWQDN